LQLDIPNDTSLKLRGPLSFLPHTSTTTAFRADPSYHPFPTRPVLDGPKTARSTGAMDARGIHPLPSTDGRGRSGGRGSSPRGVTATDGTHVPVSASDGGSSVEAAGTGVESFASACVLWGVGAALGTVSHCGYVSRRTIAQSRVPLLCSQLLHLTFDQSFGRGHSLVKWPFTSQLRQTKFAGFFGSGHSEALWPS